MIHIVKRQITLIEIMIVMFLIAMILGVVAYNYQGALEKGKYFQSKTAQEKLETILTLIVSENPDVADHLEQNWPTLIKDSPLVQKPASLLKDGWGGNFEVRYNANTERVEVTSRKLEEYIRRNSGS